MVFHTTFIERARHDEFGHLLRKDRAYHARCACGWYGEVQSTKAKAQAQAKQHSKDSEGPEG